MRVVLVVSLLAGLAQGEKVVSWSRIPEISETIATKAKVAMSPRQWLWTENRGGGSFDVFVLDPASHERRVFPFSDARFSQISITAHALMPGQFGVVEVQAFPHHGDPVAGYVVVDLKNGTFRLVDTGTYVPRNSVVTADGLIWSLGYQRDGRVEERGDYDVLRAYDRNGGLVYRGLTRSQLGVTSMVDETNRMNSFADGENFVAYLGRPNIVVIQNAGHEVRVLPGPSMVGRTRGVGLALCGERLFLNAMSNERNYSFVQSLVKSDAKGWEPLSFVSGGKRQEWLPQYPYCSANGHAVGAIAHDNLSEVVPSGR